MVVQQKSVYAGPCTASELRIVMFYKANTSIPAETLNRKITTRVPRKQQTRTEFKKKERFPLILF